MITKLRVNPVSDAPDAGFSYIKKAVKSKRDNNLFIIFEICISKLTSG